jgi:hypothetical protein
MGIGGGSWKYKEGVDIIMQKNSNWSLKSLNTTLFTLREKEIIYQVNNKIVEPYACCKQRRLTR